VIVDVADGDNIHVVAAEQEAEVTLAAEAGSDESQSDFWAGECRGYPRGFFGVF